MNRAQLPGIEEAAAPRNALLLELMRLPPPRGRATSVHPVRGRNLLPRKACSWKSLQILKRQGARALDAAQIASALRCNIQRVRVAMIKLVRLGLAARDAASRPARYRITDQGRAEP